MADVVSTMELHGIDIEPTSVAILALHQSFFSFIQYYSIIVIQYDIMKYSRTSSINAIWTFICIWTSICVYVICFFFVFFVCLFVSNGNVPPVNIIKFQYVILISVFTLGLDVFKLLYSFYKWYLYVRRHVWYCDWWLLWHRLQRLNNSPQIMLYCPTETCFVTCSS